MRLGDSPVEEDSLAVERLLAAGGTPVAEGSLAEADSPAEGDKPVAGDKRHLLGERDKQWNSFGTKAALLLAVFSKL